MTRFAVSFISLLLLLTISLSAAFRAPSIGTWSRLATSLAAGPRPLHKEFTVEKATPELKEELNVKSWGVWSTEDSSKYRVGIKSPLKVYDTNELSYIISGKMEIIPQATGVPVLVQAGDFVTFPDGFACYWYVIEPVVKHWYLY
jgi:uncharacterized cupin superfamily protein